MNYLCNGIPFPSFPERDEKTYPYAVIAFVDAGPFYRLYFLKEPCTVNDVAVTYPPCVVYVNNGEGWEYSFEDTDSSDIVKSMVTPIWPNHDILNSDGSIYLKASTPIPASAFPADFDPRSFAYGMRVGAVIRSLRGKAGTVEKEYTHYSYNGTVLPKLPQYAYPYALIYKDGNGVYRLHNFEKYSFTSGNNGITLQTPRKYCYLESDAWTDLSTSGTYTNVYYDAYEVVWANLDLLNVDGSVYLAASEPVGVS